MVNSQSFSQGHPYRNSKIEEAGIQPYTLLLGAESWCQRNLGSVPFISGTLSGLCQGTKDGNGGICEVGE